MDEVLAEVLGGTVANSDDEGEIEAPDYSLLAYVSQKQDYTLPARGEKDFEPDGTNKQDTSLQVSRNAMYNAISVEREMTGKSYIRATWHAELGLGSLHAHDARGAMFKGLGKTDSAQNTWLLPEELLFMIDRGNLECFYQSEDIPMSLQAAYAECLPLIGLDCFQVYSHLKRAGFHVLRSPPCLQETESGGPGRSILNARFWSTVQRMGNVLFGRDVTKEPINLFRVYRSFNEIYQRLQFVPCHAPQSSSILTENSVANPLQLSFDVWKPNSRFKKSDPGMPDFRVAIINSRAQDVFKLPHLDDLFGSLQIDSKHETRSQYTRLKMGRKTFVLAVVDTGIISFLSLGDVCFGDEEVHESTTPKNKKVKMPKEIRSRS